MVRQTNSRHSGQAVLPQRQNCDAPEIWGKWMGPRHYSLEVVQHPLRARMCGFGDKDRRPLAPAAVAKMIIRMEDNRIVDANEVDCSFFLVMADLWSVDGKQETNLVLHPSSADRCVPPYPSKQRRRTSGPWSRSGQQSPDDNSHSTPASLHYRASGDAQTSSATASMAPPQTHGYTPSTYPFPQQQDPAAFQPAHSYAQPPDTSSNWAYPTQPPPMERSGYHTPVLPSIQSFGRQGTVDGSSGLNAPPPPGDGWHPGRGEPEPTSYRTWPIENPYSTLDNTSFPSQASDPTFRSIPPAPQTSAEGSTWSQAASSSSADSNPHARNCTEQYCQISPSYESPVYASATHMQHQSQAQYYSGNHAQNHNVLDTPPASTIPPLPRNTYTRTLVGPLSASACLLFDEHRKPGIFFLFQDLSVRTEGSFRLRLRLVNIGAPPAPGPGASRTHTDVSTVLAQTFTEPFNVYSAKKFPGVPETTPLSIALGNQGQKLPLRNRHGSRKSVRKREREDSSHEDSGDA